MQIIYDLVLPQLLLDYVRSYDNEVLRNQFTLDRILPNRQIEDLEYRIRQGALVDTDVAEFRAWDTPAPMTGRAGVTRIRGELAPVSRQIALGEEEMLRLRALDSGNSDAIIQAIYDDSERMIRSVQGRIELARGQALTTGKVTIAENGLAIEADFGLNALNKVTAANLWTDHTASKPLTDLLTWQDYYVSVNGVRPGKILMSQQRLADMYLNLELRQVSQGGFSNTPGRINLEAVSQILSAYGLAPIELYDTKVRVNGVSTPVIDPKFVLLLPDGSEPFGNTFYGVTAEAIKLRSKGMIDKASMPGVVAVIAENDHPVQTFTVGTAIALPVIPNPSLLMVATVTA